MILHLSSDGPNTIELHVHDDAQVSVRHANPSPGMPATNLLGGTRPLPRLLMLALAGVLGAVAGYGLATRVSSAPPRTAALAPPALAAVPSSSPLSLQAQLGELQNRPVPMPDDVPAALAQHLNQRPAVIPPSSAPAPRAAPMARNAPRSPATGSAFGLE